MRQINSYGVNMADDTRQVRIEERLKIKIGEAKNLPARSHGGGSHRDTYCVLSLDQEEIFRTSTMERTLNPFFGEEFQFEVPRRFRYLSIYAFDRDKHTKQDRVLGKVAIKREDLHLYNNKDHWFALRAVDADSEVQGKAHIEISCAAAPAAAAAAALAELSRSESLRDRQQWTSRSKPPLHSMDADASPTAAADYWSDPERERHCATRADPDTLLVRVLECSELTTKSGQCDPFALVTVTYSSGRKLERRTKCRKKTVNPQFDECFCFPLQLEPDHKDKDSAWSGGAGGGGAAVEARVSVWHDAATPGFLGEVRLQLRNPPHAPARAWYFLTSRCAGEASRGATPPGTRLSAGGGACALGSLRLLLQYTVDHVFPLPQYRRLNTVFLKSINVKPITASAVYILGEIVTNKTDAAQPLVRLFTHHDLIVPVVRQLADAEISALTDATTIFRGNTLVSKMMDEAMRLVGGGYLRAVLRPTLAAVLAERKPCEIDPARVKPSTPAHANLANLKDYVERVFGAITSSYASCPAPMCRLFDALRQCAARHFPRNHEVRYSVVSGFIFLRFFAPAILGPRLFDLTTEQIDPQTNRTLTLISKTIQSLGNLVSSRSAQQVCKEEYMAALYRSFCTPRHVQAIRQFLEIISTGADTYNNNLQDTPILLKEGTMIKRSEMARGGGGGSPRRRWTRGAAYAHAKRRHFRLTSGELSWSRGGGGKAPVRRLALAGVLAVAPVEHPPAGAPLGANNMFQIVHRERVLYVQANNCVERAEWMRLLSALCRRSPAAPAHAGYFSHGTWTCCGASGAEAEGCGEAGAAPDAGAESEEARGAARLALRLDPARDLQRLHTLLVNHTEQLDARTRRPVPEGDGAEAGEREAEAATLRELREAVFDLEHCHRVYRRSLARVTKVGSKQAPIGDDNYLQLAGAGAGAGTGAAVETGAFAWRTWRQEPAPPAPVRRDLASSSESLKRTEERSSGKSNRSTGSGYLKMSCLKHDLSEDSDASDKPARPPKPSPLTANPPAPPVRPICEYVDMEPRAPERRSRGTTAPAPSVADDTAHRCKEYELMSNFTSCAAGAKDVPPAVPPRSHHLHALARRLAPEPEPASPPDSLPPTETSPRYDYHLDDKLLEDLSADAYCELKVCEDEPEPAREAPASPPRRAEREDCGIFSRFSVHRKSNPTKSQTSSHRALKMSSSTSNVREVCAQPSRPFSERLTPFFLKKKSKPPEEDPPGELTARFAQSRPYSRGQSLDLNVERERRGIERSATTASVPARHMNSSIVANLKFLSLHRYGAGGGAGAPSPPGAAAGDAPPSSLLVALSSADIRL